MTAYMAVPIGVGSAITFLCGTVALAFVPSYGHDGWILGFQPEFYVFLASIVVIGSIATRYLTVGLRGYLPLPRPRILAGAAAIVGLLFMMVSLVVLEQLFHL